MGIWGILGIGNVESFGFKVYKVPVESNPLEALEKAQEHSRTLKHTTHITYLQGRQGTNSRKGVSFCIFGIFWSFGFFQILRIV